MIRINLLPTKAAKKKESVINQLAIGGALLGAELLILYFVQMGASREIEEQRVTNNRLQEEINQLSSIITQVEKYKEKKQDRNNKIEIIRKLNEGRSGPVKMMDEFTYSVPERLWVESWQEKNRRVELSGTGLTGAIIADFIDNLRSSKFFNNIELVQTQNVKKNGLDMQSFRITMNINYTPGG